MAVRAPLHALPPAESRRTQIHKSVRKRLNALGAALGRPVSVALSHVREHGYFMAAMLCADMAGFDHSTFTGLIVAAGSFVALEWRASR